MNKKFGYTLTEVLISILVISVIATVSIPMIVKTIPNKNAIMAKKAYYAVDNIVKDLINDSYYYPDMRANCVTFATDNITPVYTTSTDVGSSCYLGFDNTSQVNIVGTQETASGADKFAKLFLSKLDTQLPLEDALTSFTNIPILTTDGIAYNLSNMTYNSDREYCELRVDVNGKKGPNTYAPSYQNGATAYNKCSKYSVWEPSKQGGNYDNRRFDRIVIWIYYDGHLEIPYSQTEFQKIISSFDSHTDDTHTD